MTAQLTAVIMGDKTVYQSGDRSLSAARTACHNNKFAVTDSKIKTADTVFMYRFALCADCGIRKIYILKFYHSIT